MFSHRTRLILKTAAATLLAAALLGTIVGFAVYEGGWYNVAATRQHWQFVHTLLEQGMRESVRHHARGLREPAGLMAPQRIRRGAAVYRDWCAQCHGGPGVAQLGHGLGMQPVPGPLVDVARRWKPRELYWITRHGIKMSGMPAWEYRLADEELWSVVAFMQVLPVLTPAAYREMTAPGRAR